MDVYVYVIARVCCVYVIVHVRVSCVCVCVLVSKTLPGGDYRATFIHKRVLILFSRVSV